MSIAPLRNTGPSELAALSGPAVRPDLAAPAAQPIIFLISSEEPTLRALEADLERRFGNDTQIVTSNSPKEGLAQLEGLAGRGAPVALLIAESALSGMTGVEFLGAAHPLHPMAKRILLVERDYTATNPIVPAMTLGQIDYHLVKPWLPEQGLYPAVSEFLGNWAGSEPDAFALFDIVAPENRARAHEIRDLLTRFNVPFGFHTADSPEGDALLREVRHPGSDLPIVIRHDGRVLVDPTDGELVEALGACTRIGASVYDLAIVGAGPAGLAAAVYAASEGLSTVVLEQEISGGQAGTSSRIRNVPGFTWGIGGDDLTRRACEQAWLFGASFVFTQLVTSIRAAGSEFTLTTRDGQEVTARTVVLATGVSWRRLGIPRLEALIGAGVFYGAAASEARAMRARRVAVVGAGNSAGQAALHLAKYAAEVTMLVRGETLEESMSTYLISELRATAHVSLRFRTEVIAGEGGERLEAVVIRDRANGETERLATDGLFVMIGAEPRTDWLDGLVQRDERGYILTGSDVNVSGGWPLERPPALLETSAPGVFAAGDVRHGSVKRVTAAMGDGAAVLQVVHQHLADGAPEADLPTKSEPLAARSAATS
jgi:thioredoxin reductase (NADPH)